MSSTAVFKCPICGNIDSRFVGTRNNEAYSRKCIAFNGENAKERKIKRCFRLFELELKQESTPMIY